MAKAKRKEPKWPVLCWAIIDPKGIVRRISVSEPEVTAIAWVWNEDKPGQRSNMVTGQDYLEADKRGYHMKLLKAKPL